MTCNKSEGSELICSEAVFQNGGHPQPKRLTTAWGLASQSRCLLHNIHTQPSQEIPQIHFSREEQPIHVPPCSAPWVFTKILKPALALLQQKGVTLLAYMDDILVLTESKEMIVDNLKGVVYLLENLGFIINQS